MKRILTALLTAACAASLCVSTFAQAPAGITYYSADGTVVYSSDDIPGPSPRFRYLNSVSASIGRNGTTMECTGSVSIYNDHDVNITVVLQRSTDGKTWSNVKNAKWTGKATEQGVTPVAGDIAVSRGYQYRARTTAQVLDSSGKALETVSTVSPIEYYL